MKINQASQHSLPNSRPKKLSQEDIKAKIASKFGKEAQIKAPTPKEKVELKAGGVSHSKEDGFGDISKNDPANDMTQEKLKDILKSGAFSFNDRERKVLGEILNK